jgi:hypothetical protein
VAEAVVEVHQMEGQEEQVGRLLVPHQEMLVLVLLLAMEVMLLNTLEAVEVEAHKVEQAHSEEMVVME